MKLSSTEVIDLRLGRSENQTKNMISPFIVKELDDAGSPSNA